MKDQQVGTPHLAGTEVRHDDPTRRNRLHNPLLDLSEALLHGQILNQLPLSVVTTDLQGRVISWNSGAERLLGYSSDEMLGTSVELLYAPETADIVPTLINDTLRDGSTEVVVRLRRKSGEEFDAAMFLSVLCDPAGRPVRLLGYKVDVTQSRKLERTLRYETALVNALFDHAPIGQVILNSDLTIELCNAAFERVVGRSEAEIRGTALASLFPILTTPTGEQIQLTSLVLGETLHGVGDVSRGDGQEVPCEVTIFPLVILEQPRGAVVLCQDISARRQLENRVRTSEKFEALGRLASGVAHDYNNVVTAIRLYSDLLLQNTDPANEQHRFASEISAACSQASGLTDRLLAFSRQQVAAPELIDVAAAINDVLTTLKPLLGDDIIICRELQPGLWPVRLDRTEFMQLVLNLGVNARAAMCDGGVLSIKANNRDLRGTAHAGQYVSVAVADDGAGIDDEARTRIFDPLFTTKPSGHGLGLATVSAILSRAGGHIEVESAAGRGTTFTFFLPRCDGADTAANRVVLNTALDAGTVHVLVVDDDRAVRRGMTDCLGQVGWTVEAADDGISALKVIQDSDCRLDVLVTDGVMPFVSGATLVREFLASRPYASAVYISGHDLPDVPDLAADQRCTFLKKPFSPATLVASISLLLNRGAKGLVATRSLP